MASGTALWASFLLLLLPVSPFAGGPSAAPSGRDLAKRASEYVQLYDERLLTLVAEERYEQRSDERTRGRSASPIVRQTRSTLGWTLLPGFHDVVAVREVLEVDGTVQHASRLRQLLQEPGPELAADVRALLNAGAAYNLAPGSRNINYPTFPLIYLRHAHRERSRWTFEGREGTLVIISFEERRHPTIVRSELGTYQPGRGRFWLDETTGRVERLEFRIQNVETVQPMVKGEYGRDHLTGIETSYRLSATFSRDERLGFWVPSEMEDVYEQMARSTHVRVTGKAMYSDYQQFKTGGRLLTGDR